MISQVRKPGGILPRVLGGLALSLGTFWACSPGEIRAGLGPEASSLTAISIVPRQPAVIVGEVVSMHALGRESSGQLVPVAANWSAAGGSLVPQSDSVAHFSAAVPGNYIVRAVAVVDASLADSTIIAVTSIMSPTVGLSITPSSIDMSPGDSRGFSVIATRQDGSTYSPSVTYSATGGTVTSGGLYTAGSTAGTFGVIATQQSGPLADTSVVTISTSLPGSVLASSDWSSGTGASDAVLMDTSNPHHWDYVGYSTKEGTVISASGLGFPAGMVNVLRATSPAGTQHYTQVQKMWTALSVGETMYFRLYFRQAFSDGVGNLGFAGNHTVESGGGNGTFGSDGGWALKWGNNNNGTFPIRWEFQPYGPTYAIALGTSSESAPAPLNKNTTYRLEWSITRESPATASFHARVYNDAVSTTTPLYNDASISGYDYADGHHAGTLASGYGQSLPLPANSFTNVELGPNGSGWSLASDQYAYYGGFRVTKGGGWIGPYVPGE